MFIDIHSHIIPHIDDGSDSMTTSLDMLGIASQEGISKIIATPHFIYGDINNTAQHISEAGAEVARAASDMGIELFFGSEVFMCPEVNSLVYDGTICRLNGSKYVLIELPMLSIPAYTTEVLFNLQLEGYTPIIAHPERNKVFQAHQDQLFSLVERGILAQINATSITKVYGKEIQKVALNFVKCGLAHFVSSDAHTTRGRAPRLEKAYNTIVQEVGRDVADRLFTKNAQKVIENKDLKVEHPVKMKRKNFFVAMFGF